MNYWIIYAVCLVLALAGVLSDCVSSLDFESYGIREKTKMWRDERGHFSEKKYLAAHFGLIGFFTLAAYLLSFSNPLWIIGCGVVMLMLGGFRLDDALRNWELKRKRGKK